MMHLSRRAVLGAGAAGAALLAAGCQAQQPAGERLTALLDRVSIDILRESPERCTSLGVTEEQAGGPYIARVSDASKEGQRRYRAILQGALDALAQINRDQLSAQDQVTHDVVRTSFQNSVDGSAFEFGGGAGSPYVVTQLNGAYRQMPNFLNEQHPLRTRAEADAFNTRVEGFVGQLDQETAIINAES